MGKAGHRSQRTQIDRKPKVTQKSLLEIRGDLFEKIDKSIRARTAAGTHMLIDKLNPMARQVFWHDIENQQAQQKQQEDDLPGTQPSPEPPERTWFPRPREEQIELLNELDEVLIVGYPYTGRGEILDKLTPEYHSGWDLEKAANFIREQ